MTFPARRRAMWQSPLIFLPIFPPWWPNSLCSDAIGWTSCLGIQMGHSLDWWPVFTSLFVAVTSRGELQWLQSIGAVSKPVRHGLLFEIPKRCHGS